MITFKNEGPSGHDYSIMEVGATDPNSNRGHLKLIIDRGDIILSKESALYLAGEIQRVFGVAKEKNYTGTL